MYVSNKLYGRFPLGRAVVNGAGKLLSPPFGLPSLTQNPPQTPPAGGAFFVVAIFQMAKALNVAVFLS